MHQTSAANKTSAEIWPGTVTFFCAAAPARINTTVTGHLPATRHYDIEPLLAFSFSDSLLSDFLSA